MRNLLNKEITIISPSDPSGSTVVAGAIQQNSSSEAGGEVDFPTTDYTLFLLPHADLSNEDRVLCEGLEYEVTQIPWVVADERTGVVHHIEASLKIAGKSDVSTVFPREDDF